MSLQRRITASVAALATGAILTGCTAFGLSSVSTDAASATATTQTTAAAGTANITVEQAMSANAEAKAGAAAYDASAATTIALSGSGAAVTGDGATVADGTVTLNAPGTYVLSGALAGQVVVNADADGAVRIVLDNASVTSSTGAALAIVQADEAVVVLADGTTNALTDAKTYADTTSEDAPNAALFSMADLTIAGDGSLAVTGQAADGIASKDGLVIAAGNVTVEAADDGVRGKDSVSVTGGSLTVEAGGDAVKSDNDTDADSGYIAVSGGTLKLAAGGDGLAATTDVVVSGGTVAITAGGGAGATVADDASAKGVKAGSNVVLGGGSLDVDAADDAVNSDSVISVTGGELTLATGDDGLHAETNLGISDGRVTVTGSNEGLESNVIEIAGGTTEVTSADDALNVSAAGETATAGQGPGGGGGAAIDGHVTVSAGTLTLHSEGDGFDSNGDAAITGGTVIVDGPTGNGNGAIDVNGTFQISGGTLIAVGSAGMAGAPDADSDQGWVSAAVSGAAGATVRVLSGSTVVAEFTATKDFGSVVYSSDQVRMGQSYTVTVDGQGSVAVTAGQQAGGGRAGGR